MNDTMEWINNNINGFVVTTERNRLSSTVFVTNSRNNKNLQGICARDTGQELELQKRLMISIL